MTIFDINVPCLRCSWGETGVSIAGRQSAATIFVCSVRTWRVGMSVSATGGLKAGINLGLFPRTRLLFGSSCAQLKNLSSFTRFFIAIYNLFFASVLILHESQVIKIRNHTININMPFPPYKAEAGAAFFRKLLS